MQHFVLQSFNAARELNGKILLCELGVNRVALGLRASLRFIDGLIGRTNFGIDRTAHVNRQLSVDGCARATDVFFVVKINRRQVKAGNKSAEIHCSIVERFASPDLLGVKFDLGAVQAARALGFAFALGCFGRFDLDGIHPVVSKLSSLRKIKCRRLGVA